MDKHHEGTLKENGLKSKCQFIHVETNVDSRWSKSYNQDKIEAALPALLTVDCIIVDGPQAWSKDIEMSRYLTAPIMAKRHKEDYSIFLDDGERLGEKKARKLWEKELSINFRRFQNMRFAIVGNGWNIVSK